MGWSRWRWWTTDPASIRPGSKRPSTTALAWPRCASEWSRSGVRSRCTLRRARGPVLLSSSSRRRRVPHTPPTLHVLLVDDHPLFRKALAGLVNAQLDMTVVGEADNGIEALERVQALGPDVVVMDVNMPIASGVDGVRAIRGAGIGTKIVMLTISEDADDMFDADPAGANGTRPPAPARARRRSPGARRRSSSWWRAASRTRRSPTG